MRYTEPYIIAEIGVNHEGSLELAKKLIELAKKGGAHAAKFQSYKAETIASKNSPSYWDLTKEKTTSQFELFKKYDAFGEGEYRELAEHCKKNEIDFLSTPFDLEAVDFLNPLMSLFKVASADITNYPLLRKVASLGKPVVLSTGAARLGEIQRAIQVLEASGCTDLTLLHCVLNYPTPDANAHIDMIKGLRESFPKYKIGYSDHTVPDSHMTAVTLAWLNGAEVIEKHFTHDKTLPGNDHYHAMTSDDLQVFLNQVKKILDLKGSSAVEALEDEKPARRNARRSLVTKGMLKKGDVFSEKNLICKRPGTGISPTFIDQVIGLTASQDFADDHILTWNNVDGGQFRENVVAIVQARMGSTRFPGKMAAKLGDYPLLEWVLSRVKKAKAVNSVILATSDQPENQGLIEIAKRLGCDIMVGPERDVLARFRMAAEEKNASVVVRVCADNPFIDPYEIDRLVGFYLQNRPDYAFNHLDRLGNGYADGFGAEIFSMDVLREMDEFALDESQREHVTKMIWDQSQQFDIRTFEAPEALRYPKLRFDIDTEVDLERLSHHAKINGMNASAADFIRSHNSQL